MEFLHVSHEQIGFIPDTKTLVSLNHGGHPCSLDTFWRMYTFIIGEMLHFPRFELRFSSAGRSNALRSFNFQIYAQIDLRRAAFNPVLDHFESYRGGSVFVIERLEFISLFVSKSWICYKRVIFVWKKFEIEYVEFYILENCGNN